MASIRTLSGLLAGLVLAMSLGSPAEARTGERTAGRTSFDGNWSVLIVTNRGPCDRGYRYGLSIRGGKVFYTGSLAVNVNGQVSRQWSCEGSGLRWLARRDRHRPAVSRLRRGLVARRRLRRLAAPAPGPPSGAEQRKARAPDGTRALLMTEARTYAALRLIELSASAVSFLSAAFSSSRFCCSTVAQSLRPSCFAQATSVP